MQLHLVYTGASEAGTELPQFGLANQLHDLHVPTADVRLLAYVVAGFPPTALPGASNFF
jgi:hypothetical protein